MNEVNRVSFKCAFDGGPNSIFVDGYTLMRMACYPLTLSEGNEEFNLKLTIKVDGYVADVYEQKQMNINSEAKIDTNLAVYYFLLQHYEPEDLDILLEDGHEKAWIADVDFIFEIT